LINTNSYRFTIC